jgi:hypothetical protein
MPSRVQVAFWSATLVSVLLLGVVWTIAERVRAGGAGLEDDVLLAVAAASLAAAGLVAGRIVLVLGAVWTRLHRQSIEPFADRARQLGVAGVGGRMWLQEHKVGLLAGDRAVTDPSWDHEQLARVQQDVVAVLQLDAEVPGRDQEHLVGGIVLVPHELAACLDQLDVVVVDAGHDLGAPVVVEACELLLQVHIAGQRASLLAVALTVLLAPLGLLMLGWLGLLGNGAS